MLLEIKDVYGSYGDGDIVKSVSYYADYGDVLCIVGSNGCGKTILYWLMFAFIQTSKESITIDSRNTSTLTAKALTNLIAYIPQYYSPVFTYAVLDVVIMGRASYFSSFETSKEADKEAVFTALEKVNALYLVNKKMYCIEGGNDS